MAKDKNVLKVLKTARGLVAKGWVQNALAEDSKGDEVSVKSDKAVNFCAIGALRRAEFKLGIKGVASLARHELRKTLRAEDNFTESVMEFNDFTSKDAVLELFDKSIARVK